MKLHRFAAGVVACLALGLVGSPAIAATVNAGKHFLTPNAPGQQIAILVSGGDAVAGVDFFVQVGDGGAAAGGVDTGPTITGVDLVTNALFAANNTGVFVDPAPLLWSATTTTTTGTVAAAGRLATLTINTTGLFTGRFNLILNPPATGPTQFAGVTTTLTSGWLQIGSPQAADFDENGAVDSADLANWRAGFGTAAAATHGQGDANADNAVDGGDYLVWQRQLGGSAAAANAAAVPEPSPLALLGFSWLAAASARGRPPRTERAIRTPQSLRRPS